MPLRLEHDAVFALDEANRLVVVYVDRQKPQIFGAFGQILHAAIDAAGSTLKLFGALMCGSAQ